MIELAKEFVIIILLLYQSLVLRFDIIFVHNTIRDFHLVFFLFFCSSFQSIQVIQTLKSLKPDYSKVKYFYKCKRTTAFLWLNEWIVISLCYIVFNDEITDLIIYSPIILFGLLIDAWFLYLIYLCFTKGFNGEFGDMIVEGISIDVAATVSTENVTTEVFVAESVKEIGAVPFEFVETSPPPAEVIRIIDFTIICEDLSKNDEVVKE